MNENNYRRLNKTYKPHYLPGLDGLRAIAVIGIIIYHLNTKWLSGGFLGVDTFFVISGYLITSLLSVSYTHLTLPTKPMMCRSRWSPYH